MNTIGFIFFIGFTVMSVFCFYINYSWSKKFEEANKKWFEICLNINNEWYRIGQEINDGYIDILSDCNTDNYSYELNYDDFSISFKLTSINVFTVHSDVIQIKEVD